MSLRTHNNVALVLCIIALCCITFAVVESRRENRGLNSSGLSRSEFVEKLVESHLKSSGFSRSEFVEKLVESGELVELENLRNEIERFSGTDGRRYGVKCSLRIGKKTRYILIEGLSRDKEKEFLVRLATAAEFWDKIPLSSNSVTLGVSKDWIYVQYEDGPGKNIKVEEHVELVRLRRDGTVEPTTGGRGFSSN